MTINEASLIMVEGDQLPDATIMASLTISPSSARVTQMLRILGPKVRVMATKAMFIKAAVIAMVKVINKPCLGPCYRCP